MADNNQDAETQEKAEILARRVAAGTATSADVARFERRHGTTFAQLGITKGEAAEISKRLGGARFEKAKTEAARIEERIRRGTASKKDIAGFESKFGKGSFGLVSPEGLKKFEAERQKEIAKIKQRLSRERVVGRLSPTLLRKIKEEGLEGELLTGTEIERIQIETTPGIPPSKRTVVLRREEDQLLPTGREVSVIRRTTPAERKEAATFEEALRPTLEPTQAIELKKIRERGIKFEAGLEKATEFFRRPGTIQERLGRPTRFDISELPRIKETKVGEFLREAKKEFVFGPVTIPIGIAGLVGTVGETLATVDVLSTTPEGRKVLGTSAKVATIETAIAAPSVLAETFLSPQAVGLAPLLVFGARGIRKGKVRVPKEEPSTLAKQLSGTKGGKIITGIEEKPPTAPKVPTPSIRFEPIPGFKKAKQVVLEPPKVRGAPKEAPPFELIKPKPPKRVKKVDLKLDTKPTVFEELGVLQKKKVITKDIIPFEKSKIGGRFFGITEKIKGRPGQIFIRKEILEKPKLARKRDTFIKFRPSAQEVLIHESFHARFPFLSELEVRALTRRRLPSKITKGAFKELAKKQKIEDVVSQAKAKIEAKGGLGLLDIPKPKPISLKKFKEKGIREPSLEGQKAFGEFQRVVETGIRRPSKAEARFIRGQLEAFVRTRPELLISKPQRLALKRFREKEILRKRREKPFEEIEKISKDLFKPTKVREKLPISLRRFKERQIERLEFKPTIDLTKFVTPKAPPKKLPLAIRRFKERARPKPFLELEGILAEKFKALKVKAPKKLPLALKRFKEKGIREPSLEGQKAFGEFQRVVETGLPKPSPTELAFLKGQLKKRLEAKIFEPSKIQKKALERFESKLARERLRRIKEFKPTAEELGRIRIRKIKKPKISPRPKGRLIIPKFKEPEIPKGFEAKPTSQGQLLITRQVTKEKVLTKTKKAIKKKLKVKPRVIEKPSEFAGTGLFEVQEFEVARLPKLKPVAIARPQFRPRPQIQKELLARPIARQRTVAIKQFEVEPRVVRGRIRLPAFVPKIKEAVIPKKKLKEKAREKLTFKEQAKFAEAQRFKFDEALRFGTLTREDFMRPSRTILQFKPPRVPKKPPLVPGLKPKPIKKEKKKKVRRGRELRFAPSLAAVIFKIKAKPGEAERLLKGKIDPISIRPLTRSDPVSKAVLGIDQKAKRNPFL